jgi:hypothetical protein
LTDDLVGNVVDLAALGGAGGLINNIHAYIHKAARRTRWTARCCTWATRTAPSASKDSRASVGADVWLSRVLEG